MQKIDPQNSVTDSIHWYDLAKIRNDVEKIAARGRYQEFLSKLLERAGKTGGDEAVHTDIGDLFDAVLLQQGFATQQAVSGRGFSSVRGAAGAPGGAQVLLSTGSNDFKGKLRIQYFAYDAINELTHVAKVSRVPTRLALSPTITLQKQPWMLRTNNSCATTSIPVFKLGH